MKKEIKTFRERLKKANKTETEHEEEEDAIELEMQEEETKKRKEEDARREAADRALAGVFEKERKRLEKIERRGEEERRCWVLREDRTVGEERRGYRGVREGCVDGGEASGEGFGERVGDAEIGSTEGGSNRQGRSLRERIHNEIARRKRIASIKR